MEPKDKAKELIQKMAKVASPYEDDAKQCAIVAVEEIIKVSHSDPYPRKKTYMDKEYWQSVLTELKFM